MTGFEQNVHVAANSQYYINEIPFVMVLKNPIEVLPPILIWRER